MKKTTLLLLTFSTIISTSNAQGLLQKGSDIDGEAAADFSGSSVSMPDKNTVAIGAAYNSEIGIAAGHVRVYRWSGSAWIQKGTDIDGAAAGDQSGRSVSMPDSNTLAVGANRSDGNGTDAGQVRVYRWSGSAWVQKGANIDGETAGDQSGYSISMPDSNTLAIGAPFNGDNVTGAGHVRIYRWSGSKWIQKGTDIDREAVGDQLGRSVSMPDSNTVAIGAPFNDGNGANSGHVRIYRWGGSDWVQKGADIDGAAMANASGYSVSMPDSNTLAIGAEYNNDGGTSAGHARIFRWNGSAWVQKGSSIDGEASYDYSGGSVSMPDSNTIAIGAQYNSGKGMNAGHVRIYHWIGGDWMQKDMDIDGEAAADRSGFSVSMPDSNTVAIGALGNAGKGKDAGHVRVYSFKEVTHIGNLQNDFGNALRVYPNPTKAELSIDLGANYNDLNIIIRSILGQEIVKKEYGSSRLLRVNIPGEAGMYFVELSSGDQKAQLKVMKE